MEERVKRWVLANVTLRGWAFIANIPLIQPISTLAVAPLRLAAKKKLRGMFVDTRSVTMGENASRRKSLTRNRACQKLLTNATATLPTRAM